MTPERLEIARRFVACKHWQTLRGMRMVWPDGREVTTDPAQAQKGPAVPDLDDEVTRLGVLAVVRKAWKNPLISVFPTKLNPQLDKPPWWNVAVPWEGRFGGVSCSVGFTEEAAMLEALERAP